MKGMLLIVVLILISACSVVKVCDEINYKQLDSMVSNKEDFILFVGADDCHDCNKYKTTLNKVIDKYNLDIKYINISKLSKKDKNTFISKFSISKTPVTLFIYDGKEKDVYNRINGNAKYSKIVLKLKENDYIKG